MFIWSRIRSLNLYQLYKFSLLFVRHPRLIRPTINATKETFIICNRLCKDGHSKSNKGNAVRHALWNVLIAKKSLKFTKNVQKSADWAQKVTDLYEKVTQNSNIDEQMDLHNNAIGRKLFIKYCDKGKTELIKIIFKSSTQAIKIKTVEDLDNIKSNMVFIID